MTYGVEFPKVEELIEFAFENISIVNYYKFPEDVWYTYNDEWDINIYRHDNFNCICVYPIIVNNSGYTATDTSRGIIIYKKET